MSNSEKAAGSTTTRGNNGSIPWVRWSDYTSTDKGKPDRLEIKVMDTEPSDTEHGSAVKILLQVGGKRMQRLMSLQPEGPDDTKLKHSWEAWMMTGLIKPDAEFVLYTWRCKSKTSEQTRRDCWGQFKKVGE